MPVSVATTNSRLRRALRARRTMPSVESTCVRAPERSSSAAAYMHWLAQPHSGWISSSASGCSSSVARDVVGADAGVHVALARPDLHLAGR